MTPISDQLTDEEIRDAERELNAKKREREHAKWDAELVGRYFRTIRTPSQSWFAKVTRLQHDDYVTLERSLAVGGEHSEFVYADVVYIYIQGRDGGALTCSGFECSHSNRKEPYLKIQPIFYCYDDFRKYLGQWNDHTGPTKHCDEISKEEYETALAKAVGNFTVAFTTTAEG